MSTKSSLPSHHILCIRPAAVPFARIAARCLYQHCPPALKDELRIFIHTDLFPEGQKNALLHFLSGEKNVTITYGLSEGSRATWTLTKRGIRRQAPRVEMIHQPTINRICRLFSGEEEIAFVDADFFLVDQSWFSVLADHPSPQQYGVTRGVRRDAYVEHNQTRFYPLRTELYCLNTRRQLAANLQRNNIDPEAKRLLAERFPTAKIVLPNLDTMITDSLNAQLMGYALRDVEDDNMGVHIGGYSHLNLGYLKHNEVPFCPDSLWISRLRLHQRVISLFKRLGWDDFIDPEYQARIKDLGLFVSETPTFSSMLQSEPLQWNELGFGVVEQQCLDH